VTVDVNSKLHNGVYQARRLAQTPRTFANWPAVLTDMARQSVGRGPAELTFRTRDGITISCPNRPGARVPLYEIFAEDCYQLQPFLGSLLGRPIQVIDIGGHIGTFSCRLTQLHPQASVMTFEPSATTASFLRRNVAQNRVADRVQVFEAALSSASGTATFVDNGAGSGMNGLRSADHSDGAETGVNTEVRTISFDDVVAESAAPVDVVKIDCEGGEYDLVLGSKPESWESVQRVVIEFHPVAGHSWDELRSFLEGVGLHVQQESRLGGYGCVWLSREPLTLAAR
jgi:FkbM family methyltransferase